MELILNLYECDLATISSGEKIREFVITLCDDVILMKRYGEPMIPHFGHDNPVTSGYSLVQLITLTILPDLHDGIKYLPVRIKSVVIRV